MLDLLAGRVIRNAVPRIAGTHGNQRLSILIYHRVLPERDELLAATPTARDFDWQMGLLARHFQPMALADALARLDAGTLPERAVCVTFDDGYADNAIVALPILKKWRVPATVFVASGYLNGGRMFNDTVVESVRRLGGQTLDLTELGLGAHPLTGAAEQRRTIGHILKAVKYLPPGERSHAVALLESSCGTLPDNLMMTDTQVRELCAQGVEIGGHTVNHPILATLDEDSARAEIAENKRYLEKLTGKPLRFFAYPNGQPGRDYLQRDCDLVREQGYQAALSTQRGVTDGATDRWQLPRFTPWDKTRWRFLTRLLLNQRQTL
jgi:peptidoglycan/xylan/chitin deacetylase (PgdA/CDA1 family)